MSFQLFGNFTSPNFVHIMQKFRRKLNFNSKLIALPCILFRNNYNSFSGKSSGNGLTKKYAE